jgi:hypothetical protein
LNLHKPTGAGFAIAEAMASAFPSRGIGDPAARLAVRSLSDYLTGGLSPGGEVGGGVAVPVHHQAASLAAVDPFGQLHPVIEPVARRAGLGRGKPAVADHQFPIKPSCLVAQLASELRPGGVGDRATQMPVADEVGDGEIFDGQPAVGLD